MRLAERISSVVILGVCVLFFLLSRGFSRYGALFPQVIIGILAALSITMFFMTFRKATIAQDEKKPQSLRSLYALALMIAWAFVIDFLGFAVTSVIFFAVISIFLDKKARTGIHLVKRVGLVIGLVGVFYVFFALFLFVPFPEGIAF